MHMLNAAIRGAQSIATSAYNTVTTAHLPGLVKFIREDGTEALGVPGSKNVILAKGIALAGQSTVAKIGAENVFTLSNGTQVNRSSLEGFIGVTSIGNKTAAQVDQMIQNRIAQLATIGDKAHTVTKKVAMVAVPVMAVASSIAAYSYFSSEKDQGPLYGDIQETMTCNGPVSYIGLPPENIEGMVNSSTDSSTFNGFKMIAGAIGATALVALTALRPKKPRKESVKIQKINSAIIDQITDEDFLRFQENIAAICLSDQLHNWLKEIEKVANKENKFLNARDPRNSLDYCARNKQIYQLATFNFVELAKEHVNTTIQKNELIKELNRINTSSDTSSKPYNGMTMRDPRLFEVQALILLSKVDFASYIDGFDRTDLTKKQYYDFFSRFDTSMTKIINSMEKNKEKSWAFNACVAIEFIGMSIQATKSASRNISETPIDQI